MSAEENKRKIKSSFYAALVTGAISKLVTHPIDTIKAHIIVNKKRITTQSFTKLGIQGTSTKIYSQFGLRGFYPGIGIATVETLLKIDWGDSR